MSICRAVTPSRVPVTLKSMSPQWSSSPRMSESTTVRSPSLTSPMAIPATGALIGTPPSMSARQQAHTVPIEEDPLDSNTSDTSRIV